jgi:PKD repeat protein
MKMKRLFDRFASSSISTKIAIVAVAVVWALIFAVLIAGTALLLERPGQALPPTPGAAIPEIVLEPTAGPMGTSVTVRGEGWNPGSMVLIYLAAPGEIEPPVYALASSVADSEGRFKTGFVIPTESGWETQGLATVIARTAESGAAAQAFFSVSAQTQPTETPVASGEPTATPTSETQTPQPEKPMLTATTNLNIRSGPGTAYPVLGVLQAGQMAEVTGVSADAGWWQIKFSGAAEGHGWVSARYVTAQNTSNVPMVQAPPLPAPPTPTATPTLTPVVISDWRGEYYNNPHLDGAPILVRNDVSVNFDWGAGSPGSGVPADNFSARWSRSVNFPAGTYRFHVWADDGVRLWVDGNLVIDQWHDSAPTTYSADVTLTEGVHSLRMEYYERSGGALAQLTWERLENYLDWKAEYYNNPNLSGAPVLVRNDVSVNFDWGSGSPVPGVPADNFSARWSRSVSFAAGTYRFHVRVDDGARLWVDGNLVIDQWHDGAPTTYSADVTLTDGWHSLRMEYYERSGGALAQLAWERLDYYPDWKAEYYNNRKLEGSPVLVRNETKIDHNWGSGSPATGVPADNFSARWTRKVDFKGGTYVFSAWVDDGVRLWIDDALVLDSWKDGKSRLIQTERQISSGKHRVKVEYYERSGGAEIEVTWQRKAEPTNQPPQAVPGGPYTVNEGSLVTFDGRGSKDPDGSIVKYEWDLNYDGRTFTVDATGQTASTRYPDGPATITVALRVTDDKGASHIATAQVKVENVAPMAEAGGPYAGQVGSPIALAGTATDPGLVDQMGLTYRWDFGDGTKGSGPMVSHSYAQAGSYEVRLTVTDKDGAQGTDMAMVQVYAVNHRPAAVISGPTSGLVGETLSFSGINSADRDGRIVRYVWDFGDGTADNGVEVIHVYNAAGNYQVTLTVTDDGGLSDSATQSVQIDEPVINLPPTAVINGPVSGLVGETLSFNGINSADRDGRIVRYTWDFGDGATGGGVDVTHSYGAAGSYPVILNVTDDGGLSDSATQSVQISELAPNLPPTAVINGPMSGLIEETLSFSGSDSSDSDGSIVSYLWDFGDGMTGKGVTVTHGYSATGSYTVTLTVTDNGRLTGKATHAVQIDQPVQFNPSPTALIQAPATAHMNMPSDSTRASRFIWMKRP